MSNSRQITYYTADLLEYVAREASLTDDSTSFKPLIAVVFSAMMLEAAVNEILEIVENAHPPLPDKVQQLQTVARVAALSERDANLALKIQMMATILSGEPMKDDRQPYQDFSLLIAARNSLVHHRPEHATRESDEDAWQLEKLVRRLQSRGFKPLHPSIDVPASIELLRQPAVGNWAYDTSEAMIQDLLKRFPPDYQARLRYLDPAFRRTQRAKFPNTRGE